MTPVQRTALTRVGKLIPSLGRENENEVLAAVRAIVAALSSVGLDCHDLAALLTGNADRRTAPTARPATTGKPPAAASYADAVRPRRDDPVRNDRARAYAFTGAFVPFTVSETVAEEIIPHRGRLDEKDRAFLDVAAARLAKGEALVPTVHSMLLDILAKVRGMT